MGAESEGTRLDSWKAVAAYLNRDIATVRRWEKSLGLPVRRVSGSGRGHSVFAYTAEIDQWLKASSLAAPLVAERPQTRTVTAPLATTEPLVVPSARRRRWVAGLALTAATLGTLWTVRTRAVDIGEFRFEVSPTGVTAIDGAGRERWRHGFPADERIALPYGDAAVRVASTGAAPAVMVATAGATTRDDTAKGGILSWLDAADGHVTQSFSFDDAVRVQGRTFGAPWAISSFSIDDASRSGRVAVAGRHWTWDPGLVTVLDEHGNRRGTFVHAGWVEMVRWLGSDRLAISGYSNPHEGGMVALLDPARLDGQGPEPPGTVSHCESCGPVSALRMAVMPRTEVNRVTKSRFNRAMIELALDRVIVSTVETNALNDGMHGASSAVYEFSWTLDLISAKFSDQYWVMHRTLEEQGQLDHSREQCPDRDGPRAIKMWAPESGWRTVVTR